MADGRRQSETLEVLGFGMNLEFDSEAGYINFEVEAFLVVGV